MTDVDGAIAAEVKAEEADTSTTGSEDKAPDRDASSSKRKASRRGSGKSKGKSGGRKSLQKPLEELLALVGTGVSMLDPFDGAVILDRSEKLARALDVVAKENPSVDRALRMLVEGSGWGAVGAAVASIVVPIGWRHGIVPDAPLVRMLVPESAAQLATELDERPTAEANGSGKLADLADLIRPQAGASPPAESA